MILLSILLIATLIAFAGWTICLIFHPKWPWFGYALIAATAISVVMALGCGIGAAVSSNDVENLKAEAAEIELYYNTINYSTNEYVRFDFYQKVQNYNEWYKEVQEQSESIWIGAFYPKGWQDEIVPIEFYLNDGAQDYVG